MTILPATHQPQPSNEEEGGQQKPDQQQQPDMLMLRSSFVGDLFLDPCFFFPALPDGHASKLRQQQQTPLQIPMALPVRTGGHQPAERQSRKAGAAVRAHAPAAERPPGSKAERRLDAANGQAEGGSQKAGSATDGQEPLVQRGQGAVGQSGPSQAPASSGHLAADGQAPKARGKRKAARKEAPMPLDRQKADWNQLPQEKANLKEVGVPEQAMPEGAPVLNNIDIRQRILKVEVK